MLKQAVAVISFAACAAASAQATLYAVDGANLLTLDPATGATLTSTPIVPAPTVIAALAYDSTTSTMYMSSTTQDNLWTVNLTTGAATLVGLYNVGATVVMHGL